MKQDILDLNNGIVPDKLMFCIKKRCGLDWDKVMYNARYKTADFHRNKFPQGNIIGFEKVLEYMAKSCLSPEEEIKQRQNYFNEEI